MNQRLIIFNILTIVITILILGAIFSPAQAQPDLVPPGSKVIVTPGKAITGPSTQIRYQKPVNDPVVYPIPYGPSYLPYYTPYIYPYYPYPAYSTCDSSCCRDKVQQTDDEIILDPDGYPVLKTYLSKDEAQWRKRFRK